MNMINQDVFSNEFINGFVEWKLWKDRAGVIFPSIKDYIDQFGLWTNGGEL